MDQCEELNLHLTLCLFHVKAALLIIQSEGSADREKGGHDFRVRWLEDNWPLATGLNLASIDLELKR